MNYKEFLEQRLQHECNFGFEPLWIPDWLKDFQKHLLAWCLHRGRSGMFADCGMGKTPMQLVWAENVARKTGKRVLILTPLAVSYQTLREAEKFNIGCSRSSDGRVNGEAIVVTNYERLHYFDASHFAGVVCDESSAIKNFDAKRTGAITDFMRQVPYRLLCTATAAPNDYFELGTSSEALGVMGFRDMITMFFKHETSKDHLGWGRTKYRFRGHAERPFWRWVCSWARAIRKPSDLGFSDDEFILPPLNEIETVLETSTPRSGMLLAIPAQSMDEEREERRVTLKERCEKVASMIPDRGSAIVWCHLNPEGDLLEKLIPDSVQVNGSMSDDAKEHALIGFAKGDIQRLITKPKIGCWGMNYQHCNKVFTFPSHSYEQYYQLVRRCWRYGQTKPVDVNIVATAGEEGVTRNLQRKSEQASRMFSLIVELMNDAMSVDAIEQFPVQEKVPSWL